MKWSNFNFFLGLIFTFSQIPSFSKDLEKPFLSFDIAQNANKGDWKFFMASSPEWKKSLWTYYSKRNQKLRDWAWTWRLAWIKSCVYHQEHWCFSLLEEGLTDKALVVRAEAAEAIGLRFENSKNKHILKLLTAAYHNKENLRNDKPLYVKRYILYAIKKIGGEDSLAQGQKLASHHRQTKEYWNKLTSTP